MNKFEKVFSDGHHMSLAEGGSHVWWVGGASPVKTLPSRNFVGGR